MASWLASSLKPTMPLLSARPSPTLFFLLVGTFLLTLVPHVAQFPLWITLVIVLTMVVRAVLEFYRAPLPSTLFCGLMALCLLSAIFIQYHTVLGRDAGTAFTAGLLAIKFYELRGPRDVALIIFSCFFVVMSSLLYSQVIELFVYCLIMMWVLTALLVRTQMGDRDEDHLTGVLGSSGIVFLQALPLALFLFLFFPRYTGKLQVTINDASIGLSNEVTPGVISSLSQNSAEAMYVRFISGEPPAIDQMYWRALVLSKYENGAWVQGPIDRVPQNLPQPAPHTSPIVQEITVYPHFKKWLFALDYPIRTPENSDEPGRWAIPYHGAVLQVEGVRNVDHKERYLVTSAMALAEQEISNTEGKIYTDLPDNEIDDQVKQLADQLHEQNPDEQDYIRSVLHYFRQEKFVYSTTPGAEPAGREKEWLADFLFKRKTGFCEHFASSFAVLMRQEKIPARVVVGYHGAEFNPYANTYTVRQYNAHAWDEVWVEARKEWMRVDPVAILSRSDDNPFANGANQNNSTNDQAIQSNYRLRAFFGSEFFPGWLHQLAVEAQMRRDQIESNWDDLIFSYDPEAQGRLAAALGLGRDNAWALGGASLFAIGLCAIFFRQWMRRKKIVSPVEDLYSQFCRGMAQRGVLRSAWEGPLAYTDRVAEAFPEKSRAIHDLGQIVARIRYGREPVDPAAAKELKTLLTLITASQAASSSRES